MHSITDLEKRLREPAKSGSKLVPIAGKRGTDIAVVFREWYCGCHAMTQYVDRRDLNDLPTQYEPCERHQHDE